MTFAETLRPEAKACAATLSFDAAQAILAAHAQPLGIERVKFAKAGRRVLAEPLCARIDAPRYDAAAMDGFAVREEDRGLRRFRVIGAAYPASSYGAPIGPGEAVRIMTGAQMPAGAGAVLVREQVEERDGWIALAQAPPAKRHVRPRASDMARGDIVLAVGRVLDPRALLVAAAADANTLAVWLRPRVAVITSGDELTAPGLAAEAPSQIPDCLSEALLLLVRQYGGAPVGSNRVPDAPASIEAAACEDCDVLVVAGGASRGDRDFAKLGLARLGLELAFADVAIKPGKPVWYGRIGDRHVLGLPGNPTAAMTVARLFLVPLLKALGGCGFAAGIRWREAPLLAAVPASGSREAFLCAEWCDEGVRVIERQSASAQVMLSHANALVRRPAHCGALAAGDFVPVLGF